MSTFTLYTDGSTKGNGTPQALGGWAFVLLDGATQAVLVEDYSREPMRGCTNNIAEATAVLMGLKLITEKYGPGQSVQIISDSKLILMQLFGGWQRNKNRELLARIDTFVRQHRCTYQHVKGHAGNIYNERCDELAGIATRGA